MYKFKELFEQTINEGTPATIAVLQKDGKVKMSLLQYDGYLKIAGKELKDNFSSDVYANQLVQQTGHLAGFWDGHIEYNDGKRLKTFKDVSTYNSKGHGAYGTAHNYFWDGEAWYYGTKINSKETNWKKI